MDLIHIIREELDNILNEAYVVKDDRFRFKQQVINSSFYNYQGFSTEFDAEINESNILVNWSVSFWLNQAGIENFIVDVEGLEGTYTLLLYNKQTDKVEQETPKNIAENDWKFVINDISLMKGGTLYVSSMDFDFKNNTCTVSF